MTPKIRNIIIFAAIGMVFVLIYIFFIRSSSPEEGLVSSPATTPATLPSVNNSGTNETTPAANTSSDTSLMAKDFLALLLGVKGIKLDDTIFSDPSFGSFHDSTIVLTPDTSTGRSNPFAPFGADNAVAPSPLTTPAPTTPAISTTTESSGLTTSPVSPPPTTTPPKITTPAPPLIGPSR
jgi:hypothetical protein